MTLIGAFAAKPVAAASDSMPLSDATAVAFGSIMSQVQMSAEEPSLLVLPSAFVPAELMSASEAETLSADSAAAIPSLTEEPQLLSIASEVPATPPLRPTAVAPEAVASEALVFQAAQTGDASPTGQASQPAETGQTGQPSLASQPSLTSQPSPTSEPSATPAPVVSALAPAALASSVPAVPTPQGATTAPTATSAVVLNAASVVVASAAPVAEAETRPTANATPRAVATQVAPVIMSIVQRPTGSHQVTMTVNPDSLGPVTVRAHISATGDVRVELFGATDAGRDALRMIVVDLRRDLAAAMPNASLSLSSGSASASGSGSGTASDGAAGERASGNAPGQQQPDQGLRPQREPHLSRNTTGPYAAPPTSAETHATPGVALDTFA